MTTTKEKTCCKCGVVKPLYSFWRKNGMPDGYRGACKECSRSPAATTLPRKGVSGFIRKITTSKCPGEVSHKTLREDFRRATDGFWAVRPFRARAKAELNFAREGQWKP